MEGGDVTPPARRGRAQLRLRLLAGLPGLAR
ncbi:hypothetical protein Ae406Ps2_4830c [Pseudonocardia sp. Ae406_Ps2]|nr:hypothetical protein Ae331Ps2_1124 [Pseudonocardia sp. Ae331_Ps2]OLM04830.1 hypothetical protein Ae406Ps2_4830c [Pseudonocardia sp. Ae406_Ps2]